MQLQQFIFSERKTDRLYRHLLFWFVLAVYFAMLQAANPLLKPASSYMGNLPSALARSFLMLVPQAFAAYSILYLVVPLYIRRRQLAPALLLLLLIWIASASINIQMTKNVNPRVLQWILPASSYRYMEIAPSPNFIMGLLNVTKGVFTGAGFLVMFRYIRQWYLKQQRNIQLQKENAEARLQLLTAQVHPHFLFNTLNNIYSQTQTQSPGGSAMIMALSDMLRYILEEGNKPLGSLREELEMLRTYINLERARFGDSLDLHSSIPDDHHNLRITPLILLPFVENSFRQGPGIAIGSYWINISIDIQGNQLTMKIMNGKTPVNRETNLSPAPGIENGKKRLELLYPGRYDLQITDEEDVFIVNLRIELVREEVSMKLVPTETKEYHQNVLTI